MLLFTCLSKTKGWRSIKSLCLLWSKQIFAMVQYFLPRFFCHLTCPMTLESLKFDAHVQGDEFFNGSNFVVIYRVYFGLMSTNLNTKFLSLLPSNLKKLFFLKSRWQTLCVYSKTFKMGWDYNFGRPRYRKQSISSPIERDEIDQIIEEPNGRITLRFKSFREFETKAEPSIPVSYTHLTLPTKRIV